jgi:hypothetical protein
MRAQIIAEMAARYVYYAAGVHSPTELPEFLMPVSGCTPYLPRVAAIFFAPKM